MQQSESPLPATPNKDGAHLRILAICHYVYAGLLLFSLIFVFGHYFLMTTVMEMEAQQGNDEMPEEVMGYFRAFYVLAGVLLIALAVANFFVARFLKQRKNRIFTFVMAALNCLNMPLGTTLGVFTIIVLMRPSVMETYTQNNGN